MKYVCKGCGAEYDDEKGKQELRKLYGNKPSFHISPLSSCEVCGSTNLVAVGFPDETKIQEPDVEKPINHFLTPSQVGFILKGTLCLFGAVFIGQISNLILKSFHLADNIVQAAFVFTLVGSGLLFWKLLGKRFHD